MDLTAKQQYDELLYSIAIAQEDLSIACTSGQSAEAYYKLTQLKEKLQKLIDEAPQLLI